MFSFLFRTAGLFTLALALVLAVLDITRSITAASIVLTPLGKVWAKTSGATLLALKEMTEKTLHPVLWDPVLTFILSVPSWAIFWFIAMVFFWLGQKRQTPYGRFARR